MYALDDSPLFSFDGTHCQEMNVAFLPSQYPFVPGQTIPCLTVNGRHGSLRYPGRTFRPAHYRGTLYFLNDDGSDAPITTQDMLRRSSDVAAWLCGKDGRGQLILDALDDRYFIAELENRESALTDADWMSGQATISFICQPFARSVHEHTLNQSVEAGQEKRVNLGVAGNCQTPLAFAVTNTSGKEMNTLTIRTEKEQFFFSALMLGSGETLRVRYTEDDILLIQIEDTDGALRSAMGARTPESDDDLMLDPGVNAVTVEAETSCTVRLLARGRWI